jgi:hypothetical protein
LEPERFEKSTPTARDKNYPKLIQNSVVREHTIIHMNQIDIPFKFSKIKHISAVVFRYFARF